MGMFSLLDNLLIMDYRYINVIKIIIKMCALIPGDKSLLSLSLSIVPLLLVVIFVFRAAVFTGTVPLFGPVVVSAVGAAVVVVVTFPWPRSGPRAGPTSYADPSDVSRFSESTLTLLTFPLSVSRFREFRAKTIRRQAPFAAVAAVAAAGTSAGSTGAGTPTLAAVVRARSIWQRHNHRGI